MSARSVKETEPMHACSTSHAVPNCQGIKKSPARAGLSERSQNYLYLQTQYRSYSEGLMLRKHVEANTRFLADVLLTNPQPVPELSWCTTLAMYVLLPGDRVLAGKRGAHLRIRFSSERRRRLR